MKRFLTDFFIALGIVIAAGVGIIVLALAAFDVDLLSGITGGKATEQSGTDSSVIGWEPIDGDNSAAAEENENPWGSAESTPYVEIIPADDPYYAAYLTRENAGQEISADNTESPDDGTQEDSNAEETKESSADSEAQMASYTPMDGTYSGAVTEAGGDFSVADGDGSSVTFTFAGDILFSGDYATGIKAGANGIMSCFDAGTTELMQSADVFMVNNEFEYTTGGTPVPDKKYTLRANPGTVDWLKEMGVDIVSLANNHMFDFQDDGLQDTLNTLRSANMPYVGAGENIDEASRTAYIHILTDGSTSVSSDPGQQGAAVLSDSSTSTTDGNGFAGASEEGLVTNAMTIAIINATQVEQYENPDTRGATETESGVFRCYDPALLYQRVSEAKQNADFVIVYIHWGVESNQEKESRQDELADGITKAGANLIVGDHPHVLQAIGAVNGKPVAYSLGNFFFTSHTTDTGLLQAVFDPSAGTMTGLRFVPCLQTNTAVQLLDGSEKTRVLDEMRGLSEKCGVSIDDDGWVTW